jgi:hypothetical protein
LVIRAPSRVFNPTLSQTVIDEALDQDPFAAKSEWLAEFRDDVSNWVSLELIEQCVERGTIVRQPTPNAHYYSFVDPSGGQSDSFTCAIAHSDHNVAVLDCLIEIKAPFSPDIATAQIGGVLSSYGLRETTGDRYAGAWVVEAFKKVGIRYEHSERDRSAIYMDCLPLINSGRVRLLDNRRLINQFAGLERLSTATREKVDHCPGAQDDCSNAAAGALTLAATGASAMETWNRFFRSVPDRPFGGLPQSALLYGGGYGGYNSY